MLDDKESTGTAGIYELLKDTESTDTVIEICNFMANPENMFINRKLRYEEELKPQLKYLINKIQNLTTFYELAHITHYCYTISPSYFY